MTYETFLSVVKKTSRVKLHDAIKVLQSLYTEANREDNAIEEYSKIYDLIDFLFQQPVFEGDDSDYHNIAVVCAKQEDYDSACKLLDIGMQQYPYCIDLLADYLCYGVQCNRIDKCKTVYERLQSQESIWSWRAFKFSIDFLTYLTDVDGVNRDEIIETLIDKFQKSLPEREDSYLVEAEYLFNRNYISNCYSKTGNSFVSVLTYTTSDECPVKRTPKCDLKLADYYYCNGKNIDEAIRLLNRCKKDSVEVQQSVNREYVFVLLALCYVTQYYNSIEERNIDEQKIEEIVLNAYKNYHIAAIEMYDLRVQDCKKIIEAFVRETGIPYPYDDNIEN